MPKMKNIVKTFRWQRDPKRQTTTHDTHDIYTAIKNPNVRKTNSRISMTDGISGIVFARTNCSVFTQCHAIASEVKHKNLQNKVE